MRVHQIARALALSVAVAAIALIAVAPASAAEDVKEVKTRVKIKSITTGVRAGDPYYVVRGFLRSRKHACQWHRPVWLIPDSGFRVPMDRPTGTNRRGKFEISVRQSKKVSTFRVIAPRFPREVARAYEHGSGYWNLNLTTLDADVTCKRDRSRRFTLPPASEAGIAAAAPVAAAEDASSGPAATAPSSTAAGFPPGASPPEVKSRVKINSIRRKGADAWLVEGVVRSPVKGCERHRLVKLYPGRGDRPGSARDKDRTDRRGRFTLYGTGVPRGASIHATSALSKPHRRATCKADEKRLTFRRPSEAGIAAAPASAIRKIVQPHRGGTAL